MSTRILIIRCVRCNNKVFKYLKIGEGKVWHCWKGRIIEDYSIYDGKKVRCKCGNLIGVDEGKWIKLKQHAIKY